MALTERSKERLLKVIEAMDSRPKGMRFDLIDWFYVREHPCGSSACSIGCAGIYPWFRKRGFRLRGGLPAYKRQIRWEAVYSFFGVDAEQAEYLFRGASYKRGNSYDVARRIEKFVKNDGAIP